MKVYVAIHKESGCCWRGNRVIYSSKGAIKSAMNRYHRSSGMKPSQKYDIYEYELKDGKVIE